MRRSRRVCEAHAIVLQSRRQQCTTLAAFCAALAASLLVACGSARRDEPFSGAHRAPSAKIALGERVFDRNCSQCHPGGEGGLGPALNNKPLPQWAIGLQVRKGVGSMPAFSRAEISNEQLDAVTTYMVWLRRQRR
jgi:mono/diheme cytochrome c family protein